ncbi:hypothetical protein IJ135_01250 [Candidatus Saccharibacteria bacterium]|nr:hypothetical protein [Candidatus Saccharibacteria bacterium]
MNVAEWILVAILGITLFIFLVVGIIAMVKGMEALDEIRRVAIKGQNIADSANDVVTNVKGMTSIGGTVEMLVDKYVNPKIKEKIKEENSKERNSTNGRTE